MTLNEALENCPDGAINALFSVSPTEKVYFSKGNLQYQASTKTWRFAEHQWDIIGSENSNISENYDGWIDLFGWGTSGYNGKNPWMTSNTSTDYGNGNNDIAGTNYDWGLYNTISNAEGKCWRTLTRDEWAYVFYNRSTSSGMHYVWAQVNGVNGIILLPDNWDAKTYKCKKADKFENSCGSNIISLTDWTYKFEANGAVFLPAAGCRGGSSFGNHNNGYWSATCGVEPYACSVGFSNGVNAEGGGFWLCVGLSVRLVCDVEE